MIKLSKKVQYFKWAICYIFEVGGMLGKMPSFILNFVCIIQHEERRFVSFQIYKNLYGAMLQGPRALERPDWWRDFVNKPVVGSLKKSKL